MSEEIWLPSGEKYEVSNLGRIRYSAGSRKGKAGIGCIVNNYLTRSYWRGNGTREVVYVHRLVAQAFIPNPENKPQVNHINGIKTDNRVENLEWCTAGDNQRHAYSIGLHKPTKGEMNGMSKLTADIVREIRLDKKSSHRELAIRHNVSKTTLLKARRGESWKSVA